MNLSTPYTKTYTDVHTNALTHNLKTCLIYMHEELPSVVEGDFEIFKAKKTHAYTARYKTRFLHSAYDPLREAENICKELEHHSFDSIILVGTGLGHALVYAQHHYPYVPIVCVEYDLNLFANLLHTWHYPHSEGLEPYSFFVNARSVDITEHLREKGLRQPYIIQTHIAHHFFPKSAIESLCTEVRDYATRAQVNDNTLCQFSHLWQRNIIRNCTVYPKRLNSLSLLSNTCRGLPALLCCAGPSLHQQLPYIAQLKPHMLTVAVDTAMGVLSQQGIVPDFICSVDPQYVNTQHLHWNTAHAPHYLIDLAASPRLFQLAEHTSMFFVSKPIIPLGQALSASVKLNADIHSGGSVATFAWDALRFMGVDEIYTMGLDLSYPLRTTHSRGCVPHIAAHCKSTRNHPAETALQRALFRTCLLSTSSYINEPVLTDARLMVYHKWFETMHKKFPHVKTYTFCKHAARIPAVLYREAEEVMQAMTSGNTAHIKDNLRLQLAQCAADAQEGACQKWKTAHKNAEYLQTQLMTFSTQCNRAASIAHKDLRSTLSPAEIQELQHTEQALVNEERAVNHAYPSVSEIVGFFVQRDIQSIMTQHNMSTDNATYAKTYELYKAMYNCAQDLLQLLHENLMP